MFALRRKLTAPGARLVRQTARSVAASSHPGRPVYPPYVKDYATLLEMQAASCKEFKDHNFIGSWKGSEFEYITYQQFGTFVDRFRAVLAQHGVGKDDKVAIISNNRLEWAVSYYATNGRGAQLVPLYEAQTEKDWRFIIQNSDAKLLIVATPAIYQKTISYKGAEFPSLDSVICLDDAADIPTYKSLTEAVRAEDIPEPVEVSPDHLTAIVYTSGSTGNPKGVCLSHRNILANLKGFGEVWGQEVVESAHTKKTVCYLPWSHIFGLTCSLHACLGVGASMALVPSREAVLESADKVQPAEMSSVPILLNKIYAGVLAKVNEQSPLKQNLFHKAFAVARQRNALVEKNEPVGPWLDFKFRMVDKVVMSKIRAKLLGGKLEYLSAGGGKASMQVLHFFEDVGIPLCEGYGMTEASPVITMSRSPGFERRRLGSVGKPLLGVGLQIRHPETLEILEVGEEGEVCVSGDVIAQGYYKNDKATQETFLFDEKEKYRYLRTGDLGMIDAEGFLTISGRIKEQYKLQNGKFVSPAPVEDYIGRSVFIAQVAIFGDHQEYNIALIVPDLIELQKWADHHKGSDVPVFPSLSDKAAVRAFLDSPAVIDLVNNDLRNYASDLKRYEYVQAWVFLDEPFSAENDLLTQKMSLKRHNVARMYADTIEKVYSGVIGNRVTY